MRFQAKNQLHTPNKILYMMILVVPVLLNISFTAPVCAIVPQIQNIVVYNSGDDTILNVTIFHTPAEDPSHYVNFTEVTFGGTVQNFTVPVQATETFTISCNVGSVQGTPTAVIRANCTINGWSSSHEIQIPEFSLPVFLLALALSTSVVIIAFRKNQTKN